MFPETTLLPTAEQIKAMEAKMSRAKARSHLPAFDFKRNRLDMSRMRVRRFLVALPPTDGGDGEEAAHALSAYYGKGLAARVEERQGETLLVSISYQGTRREDHTGGSSQLLLLLGCHEDHTGGASQLLLLLGRCRGVAAAGLAAGI